MSLQDWADNGWLKSHQTDRQEIAALLAIVERDLRDASNSTLSADWQFGIAYNSALKLCTVILFSQGFRPENALAHYRTIMALKEIPQQNWAHYTAYLNACRIRRNTLEYHQIDLVSQEEATQLVRFATTFRVEVLDYLAKFHPTLAPLSDDIGGDNAPQ